MCTISELCETARAAAKQAANKGGDTLDILQAMLDAAKSQDEAISGDVIGVFQQHAESLVAARAEAA